MLNISMLKDIGNLMYASLMLLYQSQTAGATSQVTGEIINLNHVDAANYPTGAVVVFSGHAHLAQDATAEMNVKIYHGDASNMSDEELFTETDFDLATGDTGGSVENFCGKLSVDLSGTKQYIRAKLTPTLSAANTDTIEFNGEFLFLGGEIPANA